MPLDTIYVVRHGFRSAWSVDHTTGAYTSTVRSPTGIPADPPLTSYGKRQATEMAAHLATLEPAIDAVYSTPAPSSHSAVPASAVIRPEHGISEWFGSAPFEHPRPAEGQVLKGMFPAYSLEYESARRPSTKGETVAELYARVGEVVEAVVRRSEAEGHRSIVLCTHAAVVIALGRVLTGRVPESPDVRDFQAYTCGLSTYTRKNPTTGDSEYVQPKTRVVSLFST
ncbi:hypothetical protein GMORB2_5923 [Geosmithia morbida]|uniref:Phosphoglycerate mutase n=1 Tax=Geosmithia morbida TaxID=1094350 RepID=A0A9P4YYN2_9HYPO|nr:uncharacterized protein GMORB2_5923 [Geosmithia morbida]KAF4124207.1 hypothetical protein GMORB2_5923 [Geosmithia morbida]